MKLILYLKAIRDSLWLFLGFFAVLVLAQWMRVYFVNQLSLRAFKKVMLTLIKKNNLAPWMKLLPVPLDELFSNSARISMGYSEPLILFVISVWAVARGSNTVSGELGRGTMEMILAQPVRRSSFIMSQIIVTTIGSFLLAIATLCGTALGLHFLMPDAEVELYYFFIASLNLFGFMFFLAAITTLVSAYDRYRYRTIGIIGAFFVVEKIIEMMSLLISQLEWMKYLTFFTIFKPPRFVTDPDNALMTCFQYNGIYLALGLICYGVAMGRFCSRDIPAPI